MSQKLVRVDENNIYKCRECGVYICVNNSFSSPDNPVVEEKMMDSLETLRRKNYQEILERIIRNFEDGREIYGLDVGCARGWFLDEAAKHGVNVVNGLFPQDFRTERLYDFIIFNDVFEHLPDLDSALKTCYALLKPEGLIIINCPDSRGIFFKIAKFLRAFGVVA